VGTSGKRIQIRFQTTAHTLPAKAVSGIFPPAGEKDTQFPNQLFVPSAAKAQVIMFVMVKK